MGSPQQELSQQDDVSPDSTRRAASPYFSRTASLIFVVFICSSLATNNFLWLDSLVPRAALGIEKAEQFLQGFRIRRIPEERPFPLHAYEVFVLQLVQMMGKRRARDVELAAD